MGLDGPGQVLARGPVVFDEEHAVRRHASQHSRGAPAARIP
jgi:hypothetical protein